MKAVLTVFLKEVKENLRDRRTVINALITGPLMAPIFFVLLMNIMINRELDKADKPLSVPVVGASLAPNLIDALKARGLDPLPPVADPIAAVTDQRADVVLKIPKSYPKAWEKGEIAQVELIYDSSQRDASSSVNRLEGMLKGYARQQGALRVLSRGLSPAVSMPLVVDKRDQSTPQSRAGMMFSIMPYFFVLTVFMGGMYLAIDLTAGERERQSLEPLFVNPVARWRVLLGKLMAICGFSMTSLLLSIIAFALAANFVPTEKLGMSLAMGPMFAIDVLVLMLPLVMLLSVLQTLVAAFAKSYREAQTYLSILMLIPALPSVILSVIPVRAQDWMYAVPLLGQQMGITALLRGGSVSMQQIGLTLVTGIVAAFLVGLITAQVYRSERLAISG
ncbi:ABC transporter permease [Oleiagrimonas sp. C23AA]|uniref:ABC transporter permease n=1 Tax=Oleiagrimonas sp. C23AA TaxID=2719047 RepID=UPI001420DAE5|nr:ABC transporter permease [Oleiagrimonas sp. C23AA]NII12156.1 ABC transporter permease [Oleiagrimonas sp. C23AA]